MATQTDNLPAEVTLPLPRAYRDYLARKSVVSLALTVLGGVLIYAVLGIAFHWSAGSATPHVVGLIAALVFGSRLSELRRKTWHYTLSEKEFRLIWRVDHKRLDWIWYSLNWQKDSILQVEHDEWRGLSLIRLITDHKTPNLEMVYAREDADTVQNVVLPLIEQYRQQYRHPLRADTLRREKR